MHRRQPELHLTTHSFPTRRSSDPPACVAGDRPAGPAAGDVAAAGADRGDPVAGALEAGHLAVLDDVDAQPVGAAREAPGERVMACRAAARLPPATEAREPGGFREVHIRVQAAPAVASAQAGVYTGPPQGGSAPG